MNRYFNLNNVSGFLENLSEIDKLRQLSNISKENDKKSEKGKKRFLTIEDFYFSFFEQSRQDRNLLSDELDLVYCSLSLMLGFSLKSKIMVAKKLEIFKNILKMKEEKHDPEDQKMGQVLQHMREKLKFFESLEAILFNSTTPKISENPEEPVSSSHLNLLAVHNMQKGDLNKAQLLFKRSLLLAKLENRSMNQREYVDDIYNTNTDTKINHQKMGESVRPDPFVRKAHQSEEYLLFNSALLLLKRGKFLETVEIFQRVKNSFRANAQFWYRYGQASKGIFLQDVGHVSRLYEYYFHNKKKNFLLMIKKMRRLNLECLIIIWKSLSAFTLD